MKTTVVKITQLFRGTALAQQSITPPPAQTASATNDSSRPGSEDGFGAQFLDRAEFFYAKCGCYNVDLKRSSIINSFTGTPSNGSVGGEGEIGTRGGAKVTGNNLKEIVESSILTVTEQES